VKTGREKQYWLQIIFYLFAMCPLAATNLRNEMAKKSALAWWARINSGKFQEIRPYTLMTSSLGVSTIKV
jgi:hypothetical protein